MTVEEYNNAVALHADGLYRFSLKNTGDRELSRDIVQDSFEKLWRHHEGVSAVKVKSYLFSTAYHTFIDIVRRGEHRVSLSGRPVAEAEESAHSEQYSDAREVLASAIRLLPDSHRSVLMLRDYEGYTYREISEITDLSETQVKVYIYRARVFLRHYIGKIDVLI